MTETNDTKIKKIIAEIERTIRGGVEVLSLKEVNIVNYSITLKSYKHYKRGDTAMITLRCELGPKEEK